jgi:hypothetical protein
MPNGTEVNQASKLPLLLPGHALAGAGAETRRQLDPGQDALLLLLKFLLGHNARFA